MKIALVYYSLDGNTAFAAEKIGQRLGADILRLKPVKEYPTEKIAKYFWAGNSASFQESPKLIPYYFDINMYDVIILGTPIWAGTFAPPLRTFIHAQVWEGRKVAFFACCSGSGTEKCFQQLHHETCGSIKLSTLRLIDPMRNAGTELDTAIAGFCEGISRDMLMEVDQQLQFR